MASLITILTGDLAQIFLGCPIASFSRGIGRVDCCGLGGILLLLPKLLLLILPSLLGDFSVLGTLRS